MRKKLEGGCFCGKVRYRLLDAPMFVHCCHCTECQNQTGSAFVINALLETAKIQLLKGALECTVMSEPQQGAHDVYRCHRCKTAIWSDYGRRPGLRFLRVSTLDDPKAFPPDVHIFARSKLPWVKIPKSMPSFKVFYDLEKFWPKKSLKRREKALNQKD